MLRVLALVLPLVVLAACAQQEVDETRVAELGDFRLGHNIVIASKMQMVPTSREATEEEWVTALTDAFQNRFERYEGNQLFHFGVSVEGYMLAPPGIPVVAAPKSAVVLKVTIWDDAQAKKLNDVPHQLLIFESLDQGPLVGSGYTSTPEEQLQNLAFNASRELEKWLADQQEEFGWFNPDPDAVPVDVENTVVDPQSQTQVAVASPESLTDPDVAEETTNDTDAEALSTDQGLTDQGVDAAQGDDAQNS